MQSYNILPPSLHKQSSVVFSASIKNLTGEQRKK